MRAFIQHVQFAFIEIDSALLANYEWWSYLV